MNYRNFWRSVFRCSFTLLAITFAIPLFGQQPPVNYNGRAAVAEEIIIRLRSDTPAALNRARSAAPFAAVESLSPGLGLFLLRSPGSSLTNLLQAFSNHPDVLYAEPNYIVQSLSTTPNDSQFASLWGMVKIDAPGAWDITTGGTSFVAGVVDSGVDYTHPDLVGNIWNAPTAFTVNIGGVSVNCPAGSHGFNAINSSCDPMDNNNHGSHTSGTIGATGNNSIGVAGVNWQARIMGLKFLGASGNGSTSNAIKVIEFAIQVKAVFAATATPVNVRVLSNSWGGGGFSQSLLDEINKANTNDMLFVAAAGNDSANNDTTPAYPANYSAPNVIAVAATDSSDHLASFSNYGSATVQLGAPGVNILSANKNGGYSTFSGTSMATPHVAGAALLALNACPSLTTAALKNLILANVDPVPSLAGITVTGGRLNVNKTVRSCGPGFSISANPSSLTLVQGASGNSTLTVTALNGFSGSVGLAVTGCPPGATCSLPTPVSPAPTATSTLTISTNTGTSTGPFTLTITGTQGALSRTTTVSLTVNPAGTSPINVALAANGAVASASSTLDSGFLPATTIDGERKGLLWGNGGGWADATPNVFPDSLTVDFNGMQTINEIDVFSVQDNYRTPSDPTPTMTFTLHGLRDFEVQYWTGSAWAPVPGGTVTGNNLVWRKFAFAPLATTRIRVFVTASVDGVWSRITEVEAYTTGSSAPDFSISANPSSLTLVQGASGNSTVTVTALNGFSGSVGLAVTGCPPGATCSLPTPVSPAPTATSTLTISTNTGTSTGPFTLTITGTQGALSRTTTVSLTVNPAGTSPINVALAANGAVASASSTLDSGFLPATTIDGERKGLLWGSGGGWADATPNLFPDWLEVAFNGTQTINEIGVFSVQDNYRTPSDPTPTMTFTLHGLRDFEVQYWTGSAWVPIPGGTVTGNNLVWRKFTFAPLTTTRIRVFITATATVWSEITEIEAYRF